MREILSMRIDEIRIEIYQIGSKAPQLSRTKYAKNSQLVMYTSVSC